MGTINETEIKIKCFINFKTGWCFGEGVPLEPKILTAAIKLNSEIEKCGFKRTNAFPGQNGEVMITLYHNDRYFEFTIEPDETITFCCEKNDIEISYLEGLSFSEIITILRRMTYDAQTVES